MAEERKESKIVDRMGRSGLVLVQGIVLLVFGYDVSHLLLLSLQPQGKLVVDICEHLIYATLGLRPCPLHGRLHLLQDGLVEVILIILQYNQQEMIGDGNLAIFDQSHIDS